jgi:hypothetical protein
MSLPSRLFNDPFIIIGEGNKIDALSKVMRIFSSKCFKIYLKSKKPMDKSCSDIVSLYNKRSHNKWIQDSTIIFVKNNTTRYSEIIRLIYFLRGLLHWEGGFLTILPDNDAKEVFLKTNIIGKREKRFTYRELPGHDAIYMPILLKDLFNLLQSLGSMPLETWYGILDRTLIPEIAGKLKKCKDMLCNGSWQNEKDTIYDLLDKFANVDWTYLLVNPHEDLSSVNRFLKEYDKIKLSTKNDCIKVINEATQIISKSLVVYLYE